MPVFQTSGYERIECTRKVLKLWHVNANSVDVMRLNILSWSLLDPIGTSRIGGGGGGGGHAPLQKKEIDLWDRHF